MVIDYLSICFISAIRELIFVRLIDRGLKLGKTACLPSPI